MNAPSQSTPQLCDPLLKLATPRLYRQNMFRILDLPVDATGRDIQRREARRRMQQKLGLGSSSDDAGPLALQPPADDEDARRATERLNQPIERLLNEVFWFWPMRGSSAEDPALSALEQGQLDTASELWTQAVHHGDQREIATHNLAVLHHLRALDTAWNPTETTVPSSDQWETDMVRGLALWKEVVEGEEFWFAVRERVRQLDDPLLSTGFVRRVHFTMPTALLMISAKLAVAAAEKGDETQANRHLVTMRKAGFNDDACSTAIREALQPVRNRLNTSAQNARDSWTQAPHLGNRYVRELYQQARSSLAVIDVVLASDDLARGGLHDSIAEALRDGAVAFGNKTNDWKECEQILQLAEHLASGERVSTKLADDRKTVQENMESGNDWCGRGYWDLPQETLAQLEAARDKATSGDYQSSLRLLLIMDPSIGTPLLRCVAYCLDRRGWQIANQGFADFNASPPRNLQRFLDAINRTGSVRRPSPETPSYMLPPCPSCGTTHYTQWANGEYQGQRFWLCSSCSSSDDQEQERKKRTLVSRVGEGLQHILLAAELDGKDPGIRNSVKSLKEIARKIDAKTPATTPLRQALAKNNRRTLHEAGLSGADDRTCYFCSENPAEDSCGILVPVCGDVRPAKFLFADGIEFRSGEIRVPRCRRCRDEHREFPDRLQNWHQARSSAADDDRFPEVLHRIAETQAAAEQAETTLEQHRQAVEAAREQLEQAQSIGTRCEQCDSAEFWDGQRCSHCDKNWFQFGPLATLSVGVCVAAVLAIITLLPLPLDNLPPLAELVAQSTDWSIMRSQQFIVAAMGMEVPLLSGLLLAGSIRFFHNRRGKRLTEKRRTDLETRRNSALVDAEETLKAAELQFQEAETEGREPLEAHRRAHEQLEAERGKAIREFDQCNPEPRLAPGVQPESCYLGFHALASKLEQGWGYGKEIGVDGTPLHTVPVHVDGLVAREPETANKRIEVACPQCGFRQHISTQRDSNEIHCPCGHCYREEETTGSRDDFDQRKKIIELSKAHDGDAMISCPLCATSMKAKNLVRHFDKVHAS